MISLRRLTIPACWILVSLTLLGSSPSISWAQGAGSGAQSTFLDPSIASSGRGRASAAVFWGEDLNDWANPSLLGYQKGIRYSYSRRQLVPEFADDVFFTSHRFAIGAHGVGISIVGKPIEGLGGQRLEYGESEVTDEEGNVIGVVDAYEEIRQIGVGLNVLETLESFVRATGGDASGLSRYVDLSLGHSWKTVELNLAPGFLDPEGSRVEAAAKDWGALARVTPIGARPSSIVRLDLSAGHARRNYDDARIDFGVSGSDPIFEERTTGGAARVVFRLPVPRESRVWEFLTPEIGLAGTWELVRYYDGDDRAAEMDRSGQEISFLGIFTGRHGFIDDESGTIRDDTWGFSAGLQYRGIFGVRYDWAEVPQSVFLERVDGHGITAFFDPFRMWRLAHGTADRTASR